jgi:uncharacterized Tic20 family protein
MNISQYPCENEAVAESNHKTLASIGKKRRSVTNIDKLTNWIIKLNPTKMFLLFGLILPFYSVWLRKVGLFTITQNGRKKVLFDILSILLVMMSFGLIIFGCIARQIGFKLNETLNVAIPVTFFTVWFICNAIASKNMIDLENRENEYFFGFARKTPEYVYRFFHLFYFPFSIYWLQMEVNKYQ